MYDSILQDLRFAIRNLIHNPGFALIGILTLGLGIGGATAVFSVVNAVLIRPLPYKEPERLVTIWNHYGKMNTARFNVSVPDYLDRKNESRTIESFAAIEEVSLNLIGNGEPERIRAARVSASLFSLLGVQPLHGRAFLPDEDQQGKDSAVVLSHNLWKRRFASNPGVVGQTMNLNGTRYTIVGTMPASFWFPNAEVDLWVPLSFTPAQRTDEERGNEYLTMIGRIKSGFGYREVQSEMDAIAARVPERVPERRDFLLKSGWGAVVIPLRDSILGDVKSTLLMLMIAVALLLLIACANVASLLLVRSAGREKEMAIRAALGAGRWRLIRSLSAESLLLTLAGGSAGLLLAYWGTALIPALAPDTLPRLTEMNVDQAVLGFALIASLFTGLLIGITPAWRFSLLRISDSLNAEGKSSPAKSVHHFRNSLVIAEVALAMILATGAVLLTKSFIRLTAVDPGFQTQDRLSVTLSLPSQQYSERPRRAAFYEELLQHIRALPGVKAAGANASLPVAGENWTATFAVQDYQPSPGQPQPGFEYRMISAEYVRAMGIPILKGRDFLDSDTIESPLVALIDEKLATRFWPHGNPLGKRLGFSESSGSVTWREVIGVVGHVKNLGLREDGAEQVYFPHTQMPQRTMSLVIHNTGDPRPLLAAMRSSVRAMDPNLPIYQITTMDQVLSGSISQPRFDMALMAFFACVALTLIAVGIYGVVSYSVGQRKKEIGIRMALGARPAQVLKMILRQSLLISSTGIAVGVAISIALSHFLASLLFGMTATDPVTYVETALLTILIALFAAGLPARSAARVDPLIALRNK